MANLKTLSIEGLGAPTCVGDKFYCIVGTNTIMEIRPDMICTLLGGNEEIAVTPRKSIIDDELFIDATTPIHGI